MLRAVLTLITFLAMSSAQAAMKPLDAFLIAGQSNATCPGNIAESPWVTISVGLQFSQDRLDVARDPVCQTRTEGGSAWPAFVNAYFRVTGRTVLIIPSAFGGSTLVSNEPYSWGPRGTLFGASLNAVSRAQSGLPRRGYTMTLKGIIWSQGENDAQLIAQGLIARAEYAAALRQLIARYRARLGNNLPFYIIRTGSRVNPRFESGFRAVREVQDAVAASDPYSAVVYRDAYLFPTRHWMRDDVHYNQTGLNDIGTKAGVYIGCLATYKPERCAP